MHTRTTELTEETARRGGFALFDAVDRFRFVPGPRARMRERSHRLGAATVGRVESTGHDIALDERERGTILLPLRGQVRVATAQSELRAGVGGALLLRPGFRSTQVRAGADGAFAALVLLVPGALCQAHDEGEGGRVVAPVAENVAASALAGLLGTMTEVLGREDAPGLPPGIVPGWDAMLTELFAALAWDGMPAERAAPVLVRRAEEYMRAHSDRALTVPEVAAACGVGPRRLQGVFRAARGKTPLEALAAMRLERARMRLLTGQAGMSVTEAALASGISHMGRFAAAYRARFGETPMETMRRRRD